MHLSPDWQRTASDRGFKVTADNFKQIRRQVKWVKKVEKTLDTDTGNSEELEEAFNTLKDSFAYSIAFSSIAEKIACSSAKNNWDMNCLN